MKIEAIKRLINAVDVWVACGVFDGTNFNPNTDDANTELKQLAINNVSQQREQLLAFIKFYHSDAYSPENTTFKEDVDAFLEANNCV